MTAKLVTIAHQRLVCYDQCDCRGRLGAAARPMINLGLSSELVVGRHRQSDQDDMSTAPDENPYASPEAVQEDVAVEKPVGKWDRIPEPWSMRLAVLETCALGLVLLMVGLFLRELPREVTGVGGGMILGSLSTLLLKLACEASDRDALNKIKRLFGISRSRR